MAPNVSLFRGFNDLDNLSRTFGGVAKRRRHVGYACSLLGQRLTFATNATRLYNMKATSSSAIGSPFQHERHNLLYHLAAVTQ